MKIKTILVMTAVIFSLSPLIYAQCPEICDGNENTALGQNALINNTIGLRNTGVGFQALQNNNGNSNTAAGVQALTNMTSPLVMTQTFFYFTHSEAPVHFAGASFIQLTK